LYYWRRKRDETLALTSKLKTDQINLKKDKQEEIDRVQIDLNSEDNPQMRQI